MKSYIVKWRRTVESQLETEVEANSKEEAADIAINGYQGKQGKGQYEWPDIEEHEISIVDETEPTVREL